MAVSGDLEDILTKSNAPAGQDHNPQGFKFKAALKMAIPSEGHKDVRDN